MLLKELHKEFNRCLEYHYNVYPERTWFYNLCEYEDWFRRENEVYLKVINL